LSTHLQTISYAHMMQWNNYISICYHNLY